MAEGSPARAGAQRSEREKGGDPAPGDSKGRSPWRAFGDFLRDGKVTRGGGAERPPHGEERRAKSNDLLLEGRSPSSHRWARINPAGRSPKKRIVSPPTKAGTYREDHLRLSTTEERIETPIKITTSPTLCGVSTSHKLPVRLCATMSASSTCTIISGESPSIEPSR